MGSFVECRLPIRQAVAKPLRSRPQGRATGPGSLRVRKWILGIGAPALLIAGYVGYWFVLESQLRSFVLGWIADQREDGLQVSHGTITTGGFPFSVHADIPAPSITAFTGEDMLTWQGETLRISFPPWDFLTYRFDSPGEHLIAMVGSNSFAKWSVDAGSATGSWANGSGGAGDLVLDVAEVTVVDALDQDFSLAALAATVAVAAEDAPLGQPRIRAAVWIDRLQVPEIMTTPFPALIESMNTQVSLYSPIIPSSMPLLYLVMRDYDGRIAFDDTTLRWGELDVATEGELRVDRANYLTGAFPMRVVGYNDTIARLQRAGLVDELEAVGLGAVAGALARTDEDGRQAITLDMTLIDGLLKAEDFTVLQMDPVPVAGAES